MTLVWDSDVQAPERFTLLALADRSDDDGKCWPSVRWLTRKCQTSERTIRRHLAWLESESLIRRSVRLNDSSIYRIQVKALARRRLPEDPGQSDTPGQIDTPVTMAAPDTLPEVSDRPPLTDDVDDPCQIGPQYVIDTSLTTSSSGTAALAPDPKPNRAPERDEAPSPVVAALCMHLRDRIISNGSKAAINKQWHQHARLMIERDGRDPDEAHRLIDWCQDDTFWQSNILSMPKFRQKYDALRLRAQQGRHLRSVSRGGNRAADPDNGIHWE
jgi:hypothetical protein